MVQLTPIMRPTGVGHRRAVPARLDDEQRRRLRWLLDDPNSWVLRANWERYLATGENALIITTDKLTRDQRNAALAWLRQQRHALHRALEGGDRAPEGWLERFPMYQELIRELAPLDPRSAVPSQPGGPPLGD